MKILLIGFAKIIYMPYLNFYLSALEGTGAEIHIIKWNRDNASDASLDQEQIVIHEFDCEQLDEASRLEKVPNFLKFRHFAQRVLHDQVFDRIIVMQSLPAVLLVDVLLKKYANRFILDYRDYTYEDITLFRKIVEKLVLSSYATFVSSDAFRHALPKVGKIYTSHNLILESLEHRIKGKKIQKRSEPIRIAFWGFIRHEKINREIIRKLGGDTRFELHYYGREQQTAWDLKALVEKNQFSNVFFHGTYLPEERYVFAAHTDLIHNMYENDTGMQKAMSNKYYDGIIFRIPQICTAGSYMGKRVEEDGVGCAIDPFEDVFVDQLVHYYQEYDRSQFEANCDRACEKVVSEFKKGQDIIREFAERELSKQL